MAVTVLKLDERKRKHSFPLRASECSVGGGHVKERQGRHGSRKQRDPRKYENRSVNRDRM